jgi:HlyD family secretion protein
MSSSWNLNKRLGWRILKILFFVAIVAGVIYQLKFAPIPVNAHSIKRGPLIAEVMGTGTLESRISATIGPEISNRIEKILVDQGDSVSAGDLLVILDDDELQQQVAIAQASLEAEDAAIERLKSDKKRTVAVFDQAQRSYNRISKLIKKGTVSADEVDKATESLAVSTADVSRAEAAITEARKELVTAEKTLEYHRARLTDTKIKAPFDGLIVKRSRATGDVVVPGSSILTLISIKDLWISAWIDETEMAKLTNDQKARVVFRSESEISYPGKVIRLGKEVDRETREFIVDVKVLKLATNWAVGQRAEVFIEVAHKKEVTLLPAELVMTRESETGVFIMEGGVASWRPIKIGLHSRDSAEVISGLEPEDVVVSPVNPKKTLTEGRRISTP